MRRITLALVAILAGGCARGPQVTTDQLPLKRVVVYRNGVGYFERAGHTEADRVVFRMRQKAVGDFLATLAVMERGGSSVRAASFPLAVDDEPVAPPPPVVPFSRGYAPAVPPPPPDSAPEDPNEKLREVVLSLDGLEHELAVGYVAETPVWRPSYRLVVRDGGEAELQAWGIVQNLSGEDWNDVELTLVAGAPLAFESRLGEPVIPQRPVVTDAGEVIASVPEGVTSLAAADEVQPKEAESPSEEPMLMDLEEDAMAEESAAVAGSGAAQEGVMKKAARVRSAPRPPAPAAVALSRLEGPSGPRDISGLAAVAVQGSNTVYALPQRVTVPDESATMVLLLSASVPGEAVFLFAPNHGVPDSVAHPFRVARFVNSTEGLLERGPIAVFQKGAFLGQGLVEPLPSRATATVPFALERGLAVRQHVDADQEGAKVHRIEAGELSILRDQVRLTTYEVDNGTREQAKLLVKHPRGAGMRLHLPPAGTEDDAALGYALVPLTVAPNGKGKLAVDERSERAQSADWLSTLADQAVKGFLASPASPAATKSALQEAWGFREQWKEANDRQQRLAKEQHELEKAARETRLSLSSIEKNAQAADLRRKLTQRLDGFTTRLAELTKDLVETGLVIQEQSARFRDAVRDIRYVAPENRD